MYLIFFVIKNKEEKKMVDKNFVNSTEKNETWMFPFRESFKFVFIQNLIYFLLYSNFKNS